MSGPTELRRELGVVSAVAVTVGGVIGSGIFFKPWGIAQSVPGAAWVHLLWAGLGVVCLFGALAYAELGCLFPEAGGQYAFLREGWGRFVAFLYGWCLFWVINTGTIAALAVIFADTIAAVAGFSKDASGQYGFARDAVAIAMVLVLAVVNHFGVRWGAVLQTLSTGAKLLALGAIIFGGLLVSRSSSAVAAPGPSPASQGFVVGMVSACVAIFWAYEGWYQLPFSAAELRHPQRDLPRGLVWGTVILIVVYVATNAVYLRVVPFDEMRRLTADVDVPRLTIQRVFGAGSEDLLSYFLCLSVFGAANPSLLSTPRALYAMGKDGLLPRWFSSVHPRFRTPTTAIWSQALWTIVLILGVRTFKDLTVYVVFAALLFYAMTVGSLYVIRRRLAGRESPYKCWGFPLTPAIFIAVAIFVDVYTLTNPEERRNAYIGLGIIAAGIPAYLLARRQRAS